MKLRLLVFSAGMALPVLWFLSGSREVRSAAPPPAPPAKLAHATFAGGCFWCMESPYDDDPRGLLDDRRAMRAAA